MDVFILQEWQSFMVMMTNHFLLVYGTDKIAAMGIALKVNMITALILVGVAFGAFILSISRQGVLYVVALLILSKIMGYTGVQVSQACADVVTAILAVFCIIAKIMKKMVNGAEHSTSRK